jgi:hypothetical protein
MENSETVITENDDVNIDDDEVYTGEDINIGDFDITNLENEDQKSKRKALPPKRHLNFHLIINTQKQKDKLELIEYEVLWDRLAKACQVFFKQYLPKLYSLFEVKNPGCMKDIPLQDRILCTPTVNYIREIGPTRSLIHLHAVIKFTVRSLIIRLNVPGIEKVFSKLLGLNGVHVYCKLHRDANGTLNDYIRKSLINDY